MDTGPQEMSLIDRVKSYASSVAVWRTPWLNLLMADVIAALSAQEWHDISTAPKDRDILITGRYANGRAYVESSCWDYRGHFTARKFEPPTHWMPMPQPHGGWDVAVIAEERTDG